MKIEKKVEIVGNEELFLLFGAGDKYIRRVRDAFNVKIVARNNHIVIIGKKSNVEFAEKAVEKLLGIARSAGRISNDDAEGVINELMGVGPVSKRATDACHVQIATHSEFAPKTDGQAEYIELMKNYCVVFSIGPAGTGKTYLAVAMAMKFLKEGGVRKIILVRPAVEAGEKLGFLPGDYQAKVNPYLRPLYDAINSFIEVGQLKRLIDNEIVEIVPMAYMRGRTLDNAFIILDEAQNTTSEQMKMFLTRMGNNSRIVVTGDVTQIDLPPGKVSGLVEVQTFLKNIQSIKFTYLNKSDIVRHPIVQEIVDAYEKRRR